MQTFERFLFEHIVTRLRCPHSLTSDQGEHFLGGIVAALVKE